MTEPSQLRQSSVDVAGVNSPVLEAGPGGASESVVFVHGNPGAGRDWEDLLRRVGEVARAIAPDMPGYGGADKPKSFDYTVTGYAQHLAGVLDQLGIRRAHLVLHDFGGPWGLAWALAHPDSFASVTMINTGAPIGYRWHRYARIWRTPVVGELFMLMSNRWALRKVVKRENPRLTDERLDQLYQQSRHPATKRAVLKLYRATPPDGFEALYSTLRELDRPALVIWGSRDPYLPVEQAELQRRSFPTSQVEVIEGAGHWVFWEEPEEVASLVLPFVREQLARRPMAKPH
jgi:pimeloyl-ACP methyl ester carboxylesterase